jgi:hypothetical protein
VQRGNLRTRVLEASAVVDDIVGGIEASGTIELR